MYRQIWPKLYDWSVLPGILVALAVIFGASKEATCSLDLAIQAGKVNTATPAISSLTS